MSDAEFPDQDQVVEFDLPLHYDNARDFFGQHHELLHRLRLDDSDEYLVNVFTTVAALCDPYTQPEDNDTNPLSVACLADVAIALTYKQLLEHRHAEGLDQDDGEHLPPLLSSLRFTISIKFFSILDCIHRALNAEDPVRINALQDKMLIWELREPYWLPIFDELEEYEAKLCYYMACVLIFAIYKLFQPEDGSPYNPALNPYTDYFVRLWKAHTGILKLAFELDQALEEYAFQNSDEYFDTPENVKRALLGSSAIRCVLAYILNQAMPDIFSEEILKKDRKQHEYDIAEQPLLDFYDPLARKRTAGGSLISRFPHLQIAQFILRIHMPDIRPEHDSYEFMLRKQRFEVPHRFYRYERKMYRLQVEYVDRYDMDIDIRDYLDDEMKYVFFGYADSEEDEEEDQPSGGGEQESKFPMALRSDRNEKVDEEGIDWSDCARGENVKFSKSFLDLLDAPAFVNSMDDFTNLVDTTLMIGFLHPDLKHYSYFGESILRTIAQSIKDEDDEEVTEKLLPLSIYEFLVSPPKNPVYKLPSTYKPVSDMTVTRFEYLLAYNLDLAGCIIDEMLMCDGFRRTFIWFITHLVNYSPLLIDYVYELATGKRGDAKRGKESMHKFSRVGALELSTIERLMLLHEFLSNLSSWVFSHYDHTNQRLIALMSYVCLMLRRLIDEGIITTANSASYLDNYKGEIEVLLMTLMSDVPQARELFIEIKGGTGKTQEERLLWNRLMHKDTATLEETLEDISKLPLGLLTIWDRQDSTSRMKVVQLLERIRAACIYFYGASNYALETSDSKEEDLNLGTVVRDFRLLFQYFPLISRCKEVVFMISFHIALRNLMQVEPIFEAELPTMTAVDNEINESTSPNHGKKKKSKKRAKGN
uniref:Uncharacterized protein n=1 Tax=Candidozyma auris TaxID=498019 RepID=A0A0L0P3K9_CANAR